MTATATDNDWDETDPRKSLALSYGTPFSSSTAVLPVELQKTNYLAFASIGRDVRTAYQNVVVIVWESLKPNRSLC